VTGVQTCALPIYSHWNSYGSYFAYSEIMNRLKNYFPGVEAYPISDYAEKADNTTVAGDLAKLIMMEDNYKEKRFGLEIVEGKVNAQKVKIPSAIIYCDSFYGGIGPFLSQHFDRIAASQHDAVNGSFDEHTIEMEKPDIVIYIMVERFVPRYFLKGYDFFKLN
jgi:hypothetical protein